MTEWIIKITAIYDERIINVEMMRPPKAGGSYRTFRHVAISEHSQQRLLRIIQDHKTNYLNGQTVTTVMNGSEKGVIAWNAQVQ